MALSTAEKIAFALGFKDGRATRVYFSRRQAEHKLGSRTADSVVECYLNGRDDGVRGDSFRYKLVAAA